jgi:hypothetical protein
MTATFPTLPGLDITVKRTEIFSTVVQTAASGKELRGSFQATPRFQFDLTFNALRQTGFSVNTAFDELSTLQAFFESMLGMSGTFNYTDPVDGTVRLCRFYQDSMDIERIVNLAWKGSSAMKLISVK